MVDPTEIKLKADTEAVQAVAEAYQNIAIEHKAYGNSLPYRWEIQSVNPPKYLATISLTVSEICLPDTERRRLLRIKFLHALEENGHSE
jgi:hypothetical protein